MKSTWPILFIYCFCLVSCISNKKLVYLQNKENALSDTISRPESNYIRTIYKVQINDILNIHIRSLDEKVVAIFNNVSTGGVAQNASGSQGDIFYLNGYSVDQEGNIEMPVIGKLKVESLSLEEVKLLVSREMEKYFRNAIVSVKLGGIRYSILGEVVKPARNVVLQNQLNIFEAIANAGDLTSVANRSEVQIIRQTPKGPQVFVVDLTNRSILYSDNYFVQHNDIIYVKPLKVRSLGTGITGIGTFQSIVSVLSAVLLIITLTRL